MFADDTTIFNSKKNVSFTMQPEIHLISDWMTSKNLTIIFDECEVMCFGYGNPPPLKVKDTSIQCKISCKYLGLHVASVQSAYGISGEKVEKVLWTN